MHFIYKDKIFWKCYLAHQFKSNHIYQQFPISTLTRLLILYLTFRFFVFTSPTTIVQLSSIFTAEIHFSKAQTELAEAKFHLNFNNIHRLVHQPYLQDCSWKGNINVWKFLKSAIHEATHYSESRFYCRFGICTL